MKIEDYNVSDAKIIAHTEPIIYEELEGDYFHNKKEWDIYEIQISDFESWLTDKGYMESFHVTADHNGEPLEHEHKFADFEEWEADKLPSEVIKYIEEYLNEQK